MSARPPIAETYREYLELDRLLSLQNCLTTAHDELQFIVMHQTAELWFRLVLFELESVRHAMQQDDTSEAQRYLRRVQVILEHLIASFAVIETMRPYDFLQFRESLEPASGVQSAQYREMEFLSGRRDARYLDLHHGQERQQLERRLQEPSLWQAFLALLQHHGGDVSNERAIVQSLMHVFATANQHPLGSLTEALVDYDEAFVRWRQRHLQMVMRMIGARPGTGEATVHRLAQSGYEHMGPNGVDYLRTNMDRFLFPLLWEARTFLEHPRS